MLHRLGRALKRWIATLKFKIILITVITAVLSATVTMHFVLAEVSVQTRATLLRRDADDRERTAMLVSRRLEILRTTLTAAAARMTPQMLQDQDALTAYLEDKPSIAALFNTLFAIGADGRMLARLEDGRPSGEHADLSGREYWKRLRETGQPVVSRMLVGRVTHQPEVIFAVPIRDAAGALVGGLGAGLRVKTNELLATISRDVDVPISHDMVIDANGRIVAHDQAERVLGRAEDEPGFGAVYRQWVAGGRRLSSEGRSALSEGYLVSMAGVSGVDWMIVRLTPEADALRPIEAARRTAWRSALGVGLTAALLAGWLAWALTQPISRLRGRAEQLLADADIPTEGWPGGRDEVGELSRAFRHVIEQRQERQEETQALLRQLEAVLDHAEVGIAFTRGTRFELVSEHFCRIFGWTKSQIRHEPVRALHVSDEAAAALAERMLPAFRDSGVFEGEFELVRRSGERFWAHLRTRIVAGDAGMQGTIWIIEDVTRAREQREHLAWTATHDSLTGLTNRAAFEILLERATERAGEDPFSALFIDLDNFKEVNDTAGHAAGDALLRELAQQLIGQVRQTDTVARLGGDEFAVLLQRCPQAQAVLIAEKLRAAVDAYGLTWEGREFHVGASIGLVPVTARFQTRNEVLQAADAACYVAKRSGRNRVAVHGE
jgi:diguanylate cyclase (GGDEF)-like protein/PAS domain S-box-containing protein